MTTYTENNFKSRFDSTMQASDWLSKQLVDLQMKVETSQEKLVHYQKEHEILGIDEKQNITTAKLDELNKALNRGGIRADGQRVGVPPGASGRYGNHRFRGQRAGRRGSWAQRIVAAGELCVRKEADLKIQAAELSTQFGPSYPKLAQINNQLKEIDAQILAETRK